MEVENNIGTRNTSHSLLARYVRKRPYPIPDELKQAAKIVTGIENMFHCTIVDSEVNIQGFATKGHEKNHWKGRMDAVALGKNGRVIVIDWTTCCNATKFWEKSEYSKKLHQCLIYRALVDAHLKEYFGKKNMIMESVIVGIMIVPIDDRETSVFEPRLCVDFGKLEEEGFLKIIKEFTWKGKRTEKVCICKYSFSDNECCVVPVVYPKDQLIACYYFFYLKR